MVNLLLDIQCFMQFCRLQLQFSSGRLWCCSRWLGMFQWFYLLVRLLKLDSSWFCRQKLLLVLVLRMVLNMLGQFLVVLLCVFDRVKYCRLLLKCSECCSCVCRFCVMYWLVSVGMFVLSWWLLWWLCMLGRVMLMVVLFWFSVVLVLVISVIMVCRKLLQLFCGVVMWWCQVICIVVLYVISLILVLLMLMLQQVWVISLVMVDGDVFDDVVDGVIWEWVVWGQFQCG